MEKNNIKMEKKLKANVLWALCGDSSINKVHMKNCQFLKNIIIHVKGEIY
jgi:hypothetical protein